MGNICNYNRIFCWNYHPALALKKNISSPCKGKVGLLGWGWNAGGTVLSTTGPEAGLGGPASGAGLCLGHGDFLVPGRGKVSFPPPKPQQDGAEEAL